MKIDALEIGKAYGRSAARMTKPAMGDAIEDVLAKRAFGATVTDANFDPYWYDLAELAEEAQRDYSPWEVVAARFNAETDSEELWEAYEQGVYLGIDEIIAGKEAKA